MRHTTFCGVKMIVMMSLLTNKVAQVFAGVGLVLLFLFTVYQWGWNASRNASERDVLQADVQNRQQADAIRDGVAHVDDPAERLRERWGR